MQQPRCCHPRPPLPPVRRRQRPASAVAAATTRLCGRTETAPLPHPPLGGPPPPPSLGRWRPRVCPSPSGIVCPPSLSGRMARLAQAVLSSSTTSSCPPRRGRRPPPAAVVVVRATGYSLAAPAARCSWPTTRRRWWRWRRFPGRRADLAFPACGYSTATAASCRAGGWRWPTRRRPSRCCHGGEWWPCVACCRRRLHRSPRRSRGGGCYQTPLRRCLPSLHRIPSLSREAEVRGGVPRRAGGGGQAGGINLRNVDRSPLCRNVSVVPPELMHPSPDSLPRQRRRSGWCTSSCDPLLL